VLQQRERVWQQQRIAILIDKIRERAEDLEQVYEDKDGSVVMSIGRACMGGKRLTCRSKQDV
jgi:muramoyltetrapeptide carboxypeptidase LdcA involved in peptidoglycan recycling